MSKFYRDKKKKRSQKISQKRLVTRPKYLCRIMGKGTEMRFKMVRKTAWCVNWEQL